MLLVGLDASAQIDLTGRWRVEEGTPDVFADIVQTGTNVTLSWREGGDGFQYDLSGTFDQTSLLAFQFIPEFSFPIRTLSMQAYGSGDVLDGQFEGAGTSAPVHVYLTRCECYDGNEIDGDGCSALCRVEPCFSCTPEPSVCTPSPDAAACDDGNDCTSGEICSAGTCAGGAALSSCVNMDGLWHVSSEVSGLPPEAFDLRYRQRNGVFTAYDVSSEPGDMPYFIGAVDTQTGETSRTIGGGGPLACPASTFTGIASLDNLTFGESGVTFGNSPRGCIGFSVSVEGVRFATPSAPALTRWGQIAATLALALLALGFLWRAESTVRPSA